MKCGLYCLNTGKSVPLKKIDVTVTVGAIVGHVESVSLYKNEALETIEAIFTFPLDDSSAVYKFQAEINGRIIVAECQEKQQAKETYHDAIQSGHTAFLLEEHDQASDVFNCRLGNLPPGGMAKLTMAYVSELPLEVDGRIRFTLPNVLNPRYGTETQNQPQPGLFGSPINQEDTMCVNNGQYEMSFMADIQSQSKIQDVVSDSHSINVAYSLENRRAQVTLAQTFTPNHDLTLYIKYENASQPQAITERGSSNGSGLMNLDVLMLSFYPEIGDIKGNTTDLGEYIFVIDRSGSMMGSKMESAKDTLLLFLKSLPVGCYFNVVSFGNYFHMLFDPSIPGGSCVGISCEYNQENLRKALELQQSMQADMGGTEILQPLKEIYKKPVVPGRPRQIILITDGEVWNTKDIIQLIGSHAGDTRVFSVGIGEGASTALVKGIARAGKGKYEMVTGTERLQQKVMSILKCAMQPSVKNIKISWELPTHVSALTIPAVTPYVFSGERLILYALLQRLDDMVEIKGTVKIEGQIENKSFQHCLEFDVVGNPSTVESSAPIHRLAAKCQIKEFEDKELIEDPSQNQQQSRQKQNIITISTAANIMSKYTSFVGVDKESKVEMKLQKPKIIQAVFGCRSAASFSGPGSSHPVTGHFCSGTIGGGGAAIFGSASVPSGGNLFGSANTSQTFGGGGSFGSAAGFSFGQTSMGGGGGMFGSKPISQPQSSRGANFSFAASAPGFGFGSTPQPQQSSGFGFGSAQQSQQTFGFGSALQSQQTSGFGFGSAPLLQEGSGTSKVQTGMMGLIFLQTFVGSWELTDEFATVISVSLDDLKSYSNTQNSEVWATCLALVWLEKYYSKQKEEWEMIGQKANTWLTQQVFIDADLQSVMTAAQTCINQKCSVV